MLKLAVAPGELPSFPTRRSSDLADKNLVLDYKNPQLLKNFLSDRGKIVPARISGLSARSEEHTSELQSLRHLVCRLLLETKKIQEKCLTTTTSIENILR